MYMKLIIMGNLGRDPELKYLPDATAVCNFSVACNLGWGDNEKTAWIRVSAWDKTAEAVNQHLQKGDGVLVEGILNPDPETGGPKVYAKRDGTAGASFEMTAHRVKFLPKGSNSGSGSSNYQQAKAQARQDANDGIPF